jgi:hypothetical protein
VTETGISNAGGTDVATPPKRTKRRQKTVVSQGPIVAKAELSVTPSTKPVYPKMNCVPKIVLDTEVGFTRKLAPASKRVLADINRRTEELRRLEAFRTRRRAA